MHYNEATPMDGNTVGGTIAQLATETSTSTAGREESFTRSNARYAKKTSRNNTLDRQEGVCTNA